MWKFQGGTDKVLTRLFVQKFKHFQHKIFRKPRQFYAEYGEMLHWYFRRKRLKDYLAAVSIIKGRSLLFCNILSFKISFVSQCHLKNHSTDGCHCRVWLSFQLNCTLTSPTLVFFSFKTESLLIIITSILNSFHWSFVSTLELETATIFTTTLS